MNRRGIKDFLLGINQLIYNNGIPLGSSQYERERLISFNLQIFICIVVSILFFGFGLIYKYPLLCYFSITYGLCFGLTAFLISKNNHTLSKYTYLFATNYSVFSISYCFGYEAGFYFYFFTTPLTVYISFDKSKMYLIYLALFSY